MKTDLKLDPKKAISFKIGLLHFWICIWVNWKSWIFSVQELNKKGTCLSAAAIQCVNIPDVHFSGLLLPL